MIIREKWIYFFELWKKKLLNIIFNYLVEEVVLVRLIWRRVYELIGVKNKIGVFVI